MAVCVFHLMFKVVELKICFDHTYLVKTMLVIPCGCDGCKLW